ncbi:MAG TPA: hypothetical protein VI776_06695 [Anaerolineales bacterium]|nr:hypothetical protein [Anaerolineales bacterium]
MGKPPYDGTPEESQCTPAAGSISPVQGEEAMDAPERGGWSWPR